MKAIAITLSELKAEIKLELGYLWFPLLAVCYLYMFARRLYSVVSYFCTFYWAFFWNARVDAGCGNPYLRQLRNESLARLLRTIWPVYQKRNSLRSM